MTTILPLLIVCLYGHSHALQLEKSHSRDLSRFWQLLSGRKIMAVRRNHSNVSSVFRTPHRSSSSSVGPSIPQESRMTRTELTGTTQTDTRNISRFQIDANEDLRYSTAETEPNNWLYCLDILAQCRTEIKSASKGCMNSNPNLFPKLRMFWKD